MYPADIYTYTNRSGTQTLLAGSHSTIHNEAAAHIVAIETEMGVNPSAGYVTVSDRMDALAAAIGTTHTQNTDVGTSNATFYMDGASGPKIKVSGTTFSVRDNADAVYVDFICDDLTCATINGLTAAQLTALQANSHTHVNYALLQTYVQTEVDLADAVVKKHTQNTDTGTTSETFQMNNVSPLTSAKIKVDDLTPLVVDIRNAGDSAFASIRAENFMGGLTPQNSYGDATPPLIQYNVGTSTWKLSNDGTTFVDIGTGLAMSGAQGAIQYNDTTNLGSEATFYYDEVADTLFVTNLNVSGTILGAIGTVITGTTSNSWEINSDGNGLIIDTAGMANDRTVNGEDIYQAIQNSHVAVTAGAGIGVLGQAVSNTDTGSAAVAAHNLAFTHSDIHVPATILDTASINFGISGQEITGSVLPAGVDHNSLNNYDANRHVDHTAVSISTGTGLTGGGDISATRTLSLSHLGIQSLTDPGADRLMLWDDTDGSVQWVTVGTGLTFTHATHTLSATGTVTDLDSAYNGGNTIDVDGSPVTLTVSDTDNNRVLDVVQNDTTNNPDALLITNAGSGAALKINGAGSQIYIQEQAAADGDTAGYGQIWVKNDAPCTLWFTDDTGVDVQLGGGGATLTRATFTNASLTAGVLTITHTKGLSAPYTVMVTIFDNNSQQIIPDSITGATNTVAVDLSSYVTAGGGSIAGTWGYGYIA